MLKLIIMKSDFFIHEENFSNFLKIIANKMQDGFVIVEWNEKLPFVVLVKHGKEVDHRFNFLISCITLGLWSLVWLYLSYKSREENILVALDEDGKLFEEKCYNKNLEYNLF